MLSYQEIFNIQKTTLPLTKKELEGILSKSVFTGYVQCSYSVLVQTLKDIATAETYQYKSLGHFYLYGENEKGVIYG